MYAVVRNNGQNDFFLPDEIGCLPEEAMKNARKNSDFIVEWDKANPIQRIATVRIEEIA